MTSVVVIGARGFVGGAFLRHLSSLPDLDVRPVTRESFQREAGRPAQVVIDCSGNSRKYLADEDPERELEQSVNQRLRTLRAFPADVHVHISSVDIYSSLGDPACTHEDGPTDPSLQSHYGHHKLLAEQLVRHYADEWLTIRLAGMVGPDLRKNPVYDILNERPLRIHPESRYQFLDTADVARIVWQLVEGGARSEVFNVCGDGLISPREIARLAGRELRLSGLPPDVRPRVVDVNIAKLKSRMAVPETTESLRRFLSAPARTAPA